jgi:CHAD domain-containing protein
VTGLAVRSTAVRTSLDHEQTLDAPDGFVLPELQGKRLPARTFSATYFDTDDRRLARGGMTLRFRAENETRVWQLELPRGGARLELEQDGRPGRPPVELVELVAAHVRGRDLVRMARMKTRRETIRTRAADVVDDAISVYDGPRIRLRFRQLEIERTKGDGDALAELEAALLAAGADRVDGVSNVFRVLGLEPEPEVRLRRSTPPVQALGARLHREYLRLLLHDPGVRLGGDPEDVHQLRVATRRLRAYLRAARPLVKRGWTDGLRGELAWLGGSLGPARDLDVMLERLRGDVGELADAAAAGTLLAQLKRERTAAYAAAVQALSEPRYLELLNRLEREAASPVASGRAKGGLRRVFQDEFERSRRTFDRLGRTPSDEALHEARIRVKRARYAAELAAHELEDGGEAFLQAAKRLQDVLGDHQDAVVAQERIGRWAAAHPENADVGDAILALERVRQAASREAWPKLWRKLDQRGRRL